MRYCGTLASLPKSSRDAHATRQTLNPGHAIETIYMKIVSWNVNSLRVRLPQVLDWLATHQPDLFALQEIKMVDAEFPTEDIQAAGYQMLVSGQKSYNGVAILSKIPGVDVVKDLLGLDDPQRRVLAATYGNTRLINLYVPNGESLESAKYPYKLGWLATLHTFLQNEAAQHPRLVVVGDFNIAPEDRDVHDPVAWKDQVLCSEPERNAFQGLLGLGLRDSFRLFEQPERIFSWWDYRAMAFRRNMGMRIDHVLVSPAMAATCTASYIDKAPRKLERPSDHAPAVAEFTD